MVLNVIFPTTSHEDNTFDVDVVAIHGLNGHHIESWRHDATGTVWLSELLPKSSLRVRVLTFGYNAIATSFYGSDSSDRILQHAHTLVAELEADRAICGAAERPLIFICHGLGGILVKKSLVYAATRTAKKVEHLYSVFIATYGILFLGTPHDGIEKSSWQLIAQSNGGVPTELLKAITKDSETLQSITDQFAPLMKQFRIYLFWEGLQTETDSRKGYVVREDSAAPIWDNTERSGIHATHLEMCRFGGIDSPGYKTVLAALLRYACDAPAIIKKRQHEARKFLDTQRSNEAAELLGLDINNSDKPSQCPKQEPQAPKFRNKYFRIPHNVSSIFTGRKEITKGLEERILASADWNVQRQQKRFVLYGLGGSGKTQFCLKFVQENRDRFWGIFWVDASSVENAERALSEIGKLGGMGETCVAGLYWLTGLEMPWLLVIDNADDDSVNYSRFFPSGDRGHILVTSRNPECRMLATIGYHEFKDMEHEDAITLLLKAAEVGDPRKKTLRDLARPIARTLGYLPLALIQAGASIRQNICSLEDYLEVYSSHRKQIMNDLPVQSADDYKYTIYTTWEVSFRMISNQASDVASDAIQVLQVFAFLHFEQIPASIFERAWSSLRRMDKLPSLATGGPWNIFANSFIGTLFARLFATRESEFTELPPILLQKASKWDGYRFRQAMAKLCSFSLVFKDAAKDSYSMHPMVHFWARDRLEQQEQQFWCGTAATILAISVATNLGGSNQTYRRSLIPHIDSCLRNENSEVLLDYKEDKRQILRDVRFASVYSEGGRWIEAKKLLKQVVNARIKILGPGNVETLDAKADLAWSCWNLSDLGEALKIQIDVMDTSLGILGAEDPRTLRAMDSLGSTYWICGRTKDAEVLGEQAVDGMKKVLGPGHPHTLMATHNLGRTLMHRGRPKEAKTLQLEVVKARSKMLGAEHLDTLMSKADLGMSHHALGEFVEAEQLLTSVLEERKRILGQEHAYTLWAINDLSKIYVSQGFAVKAEDLLVNILDIVIRTLGKEHIGMLMTMQNLARAYCGQDRWTDAKMVLTELLEIQTRKLGLTHPDRLIAMAELGRVYKRLDQLEKAIELFEEVIQIMPKAMGIEHPRTQAVVRDMIAIYQSQGLAKRAEELESEFLLAEPTSSQELQIPKRSWTRIFSSQQKAKEENDRAKEEKRRNFTIPLRKTY